MKVFYLYIILFKITFLVSAQEIDDMYFTSSDRINNKKLSKKVSPAEIILSKYKKGNTTINNLNKIDNSVLEKYRSNNLDENDDYTTIDEKSKLKYDREKLYVSSNVLNNTSGFFIQAPIIPYYYVHSDPFDLIDPYNFFNNNLTTFELMVLSNDPNLLRGYASLNPMLFYSDPYLSYIGNKLSPALSNLHFSSFNSFGIGCSLNKHGTWMYTNNGTGGGLGHLLSNRHLYVNSIISVVEKKGTTGPRSGRQSSLNGENIVKPNYYSRRQSGLSNLLGDNEFNESKNQINNNLTQNTVFRNNSTSSNINSTLSSRSNRSETLSTQNRRSIVNTRSSNDKIRGIMEFSNSSRNSFRESFGNQSFLNSDNGRRSGYSAPPVSYNPARGMTSPSRSTGFGGNSNSGGSSSFGGYSGGSSFGGGSSSGGSSGGVISGGSSGGSSRGGGRN